MTPILSVNGIELKYGSIAALRNVSISLESGSIVCLIGANGAGKSSLLKAIVGLEPISAGSIRFQEDLIASAGIKTDSGALQKVTFTSDKIVARGIALVPEGLRMFSDMTVQENLEMGAFLKRDEKYIRTKMQELFDLFPILKERRKQKAGSLSGGEQQMLAISRALMSSPKLLLLDEPALGLAPLIIRNIFDTIVRINKDEGVTIFLVEQNAHMALQASQKGYVMETGIITIEDTAARLLENEKVKAAYLGA